MQMHHRKTSHLQAHRKAKPTWSRDKPERDTVAQIAATIPAHQRFTRISGVLKTLERIERLPDTLW